MCGCTKKTVVSVEATKPVTQYNPKFDAAKPVQTRDGRNARILTTDRKSDRYPIVALVEDDDGSEYSETFTTDGRPFVDNDRPSPDDLVNVPEKKVGYVNIYKRGGHYSTYTLKNSREEADAHAGNMTRLARVKIEYTEGQMDE